MLQVFRADVVKADLDVVLLYFVESVLSGYCKCLIWMLRLQCEI